MAYRPSSEKNRSSEEVGQYRAEEALLPGPDLYRTGPTVHLEPDGGIPHDELVSSFPIDDTTTLVRDPVDRTKLVRIDVGAVATGTTRVLTMPDSDVDLAADIKAKFAATADFSVQSTTAETAFAPTGRGSSTILADSMAVGQVYRITVRGVLSTA